MYNYEELKAFAQVVAKIDCVENAMAEIYNLFQDNLITEKQEGELYDLIDPENTVDTPAQLWYEENRGSWILYDFACGKFTLVEAMKELVNENNKGNVLYPYGQMLLKQGVIDSLDDWNIDKEVAFSIMDWQFDYLWELQDVGKIVFVDRLWSDGKIDEEVNEREKNKTLKLVFDSFEDVFKWIIEKSAGQEDYWYNWVKKRVEVIE